MERFSEMRDAGKIAWIEDVGAWTGPADDIVRALVGEGFQECRREVVRSRRGCQPAGGLWQGLNQRTGVVASAVWFSGGGRHRCIVFVELDGEPLTVGSEVLMNPKSSIDGRGPDANGTSERRWEP
jgi:hypothetical protein